jgi:hypothetical protein
MHYKGLGFTFQQDIARPHAARTSMALIQQHNIDVKLVLYCTERLLNYFDSHLSILSVPDED